jgi:hypothetical protein
MIPEIGLMIGGYIVLRCLSFCTRKGDREEHTTVQVMAFIGILVTVLICIDLALGHRTPGIPQMP